MHSNLPRINILIVDDHESVLEGLMIYLQKHTKGKCTTTTKGRVALRLIQTQPKDFDVVILDWRLKDIGGIELIDQMRIYKPHIKIIEFTMHEGIWDIKQLMSREVNAIVLKSSPLSNLLVALNEVHNGNSYYCNRFRQLRQINNELIKDSHLLAYDFSPIELDIIQLSSEGYSSKEIADIRNYNYHTVIEYRKRLFDKFGVNSMAELVASAIYNNFVKRE